MTQGHRAPLRQGSLPEGTLVGKGAYRLLALSAEGPLGRSHQGERVSDGHAVAIRELDPALAGDPEALSRLWDEVEVVQALDHKCLSPVLGLFAEGDRLLLVSDAPAGQTLRQMIEKRRSLGQPLSLKGAHHAIANVCNGLTFAHGALSHGALCPEHVEIAMTGQVRVTELFLGRFLPIKRLQELSPGALACAAPERLAGDPPSRLADIYAIGVMLLESLTLRLPAGGATPRPSQLVPDLPAALDEVIATCLVADPSRRYKSPQELKEVLADAIQGGPKATVSVPASLAAATGHNPAKSDSKISEQLPAVVAQPRSAARSSIPPKNPVQSSPSGTIMTPPNAPPPKVSGPQASIAGSADDDHERWLITKEDKMDYGPFPLREVRSQIEKGTVSADHLILDMETGDRRRVREHPQLADMAREWEGKHAQAALELRDHSERSRHRASVQKLLSGIFIVLLVVGGGVGGYFKFFYKPEVKTVVVKEVSSDDFFKGIEISMKVDPPAAKKHHGKGKKVLRNGKWEDSTVLGDATEEGGDETLTGEQVQGVMNKNFKVLAGCLKEEAQRNPAVKRIDIEFLIKGTGAVSSVKVNGESGSAVASCVFVKMQTVQFPKFNGSKTHAAFSLALK